jgi:hypothetical protein
VPRIDLRKEEDVRQAVASLLAACLLLSASCATTAPSSGGGPQSVEAASGQPHPLKQWMDGHKRAKKGALVGALVGAVTGAMVAGVRGDDPLAGAAAGGVAGALVGFLIGRNRDELYAGRDQAVLAAGYDPAQGYVMQVDEVRLDPAKLQPGESATLRVRYVVVGPDPRESLTVHCFKGIKYDGDYVNGDGPSAFVVPNGGGIVDVTSTITLPKNAPTGTYTVEAVFDDPQGRFQRTGSSPLYIG